MEYRKNMHKMRTQGDSVLDNEQENNSNIHTYVYLTHACTSVKRFS